MLTKTELFFTIHDYAGSGDMQVSVEQADGAYRLLCEGDDEPREERFDSYEEALAGLRALYPTVSITVHAG